MKYSNKATRSLIYRGVVIPHGTDHEGEVITLFIRGLNPHRTMCEVTMLSVLR